MNEHSVLIVEDDTNTGKLIVNLLRSAGLSCELATNGLQALERLSLVEHDVVVLDLALPLVDGWEVLNTLQSAGRDLPVVVVTAHGQGDGAMRAHDLGATYFLEKPFGADKVFSLLDAVQLDRKP